MSWLRWNSSITSSRLWNPRGTMWGAQHGTARVGLAPLADAEYLWLWLKSIGPNSMIKVLALTNRFAGPLVSLFRATGWMALNYTKLMFKWSCEVFMNWHCFRKLSFGESSIFWSCRCYRWPMRIFPLLGMRWIRWAKRTRCFGIICLNSLIAFM